MSRIKILNILAVLIPVLFFSCSGSYHTIKSNETLKEIADRYNADIERIIWFNDIKYPHSLTEGTTIFIPGKEAKRASEKVMVVSKPILVEPAVKSVKKTNYPKPRKLIREPIAAEPENEESIAENETANSPEQFVWPVESSKGIISSKFGYRSGKMHHGVDIKAEQGSLILAAENGKVIYSDNGIKGYGNVIIIKHKGSYTTVYAHNDANLVEVGDIVKKGDTIGKVGNTGNASCTHLHFEIRDGMHSVDPLTYYKVDQNNTYISMADQK